MMLNRSWLVNAIGAPIAGALLLASCAGQLGDPPGGASGDPDPDAGPGAETLPASGATVLRHLNRIELASTFRAVLGAAYTGDPDAVQQRMLPDTRVQGFDTIAAAITTSEGFVEQVQGLGDYMVAHTDVVALSGCDVAAKGEGACVAALLDGAGLRALRRPLTADERASYQALFTLVRATDTYEVALGAILTRLLQAPDFLYLLALGDPATGRVVDYELASRLSYLLWESPPDQALFDAAAQGKLRTPADVEAQATRMLGDPRAQRTLKRFFELWVKADVLDTLVKDGAVYPDFESLRPSMRAELDGFLDKVVLPDGDLRTLLTSTDTFVDAPLAGFYGVDPPSGMGAGPVKLDPAERAGILTQAAFLSIFGKARRSSPILRGVFVRERLLCAPLPPPPPAAANVPTDVADTTTTRAFFEDLTKTGSCQACHGQINPIGYGFESFDGMGHFRAKENGLPIDATGKVTAGDQQGSFNGAVELANKLAGSKEVSRCLTSQWMQFRFGRTSASSDERILDQLEADLAAEGGKLHALPRVLARSPALYDPHYQLPAAEVTP